jgi:Lrp/AsnC family transcriptional regulator for asnA, asnC and gidA
MVNLPNQSESVEEAERLLADSRSFPYEALNQKIVRQLQKDGRMSFRAIAESLNVSEGTVRNRVAWMKESGVLNIIAVVDPTMMRYSADAMLGIKVSAGHSPEQVAKRLGKHNEVVYAMWVSGRYDLLVEIVLDSHENLTIFLATHCYSEPDISSVEIMTGLMMYKNQFLLKREFE